MRRWRQWSMILAVLAFAVAAVRSSEGAWGGFTSWLVEGWLSQVRSMAFFWAGVVLFLVSVWRRGGT
jgi:hypothetical protein